MSKHATPMHDINKTYTLWDYIRIPMRHAPFLSIIGFIQVLVSAIIPTLQIVVNATFINKTIAYVNGETTLNALFIQLGFVFILIAYQWLSGIMMEKQWLKIELRLMRTFSLEILEKQAKLEYKHLEDPKTRDLIARVNDQVENRFLRAFQLLMSSFSLSIRIAGVLFIILTHVWWAAIIILLFSLPMFYLSFKGSKNSYDVSKEVTQHTRRHTYLSSLLLNREAADERTMFGYKEFIFKKWRSHYEEARQLEFRASRKWFIKLESSSVVTAFISLGIIIVLLTPVVQGDLSFGIFAALIQACFTIVQIMSWDLSNYVDGLVTANEYIKEYTQFMQLSEEEDVLTQPATPFSFESLRLEGVSFSYPGTSNYILKDLSLTIDRQHHYAFVGKNGSGKSTVVKLITGLYRSYEGSIYLNGKELREFSHQELKSVYAAIFQDYAQYGLTMKENIRIGNINRSESECNIEAQLEVFHLANLAKKLPDGLDSVLGRSTERGQELSGGEWQRIAIARSMISDCPVKILDEPTAALDPVAESEVYQEFGRIADQKTTISISHRLGSTKLADCIYVFGDGKIVEQGSHQALMEKRGVYHDMYESQAEWYR